jgi:2-(1,2-epoxy-1,2-dihydrophenyl)acetyl-CoA isomerase
LAPTEAASRGVVVSQSDDGIRRISMCSPGTKNSIGPTMAQGLLDAMLQATADGGVRAVVLTGEAGNFSSGGDLRALLAIAPDAFGDYLHMLHRLALALHDCPKPVVAEIDGVCAGGSIGLALCADFVIASDRARFAFGFPKIALVPDMGLSWLVPARVGAGKARRWMLRAETVHAADALLAGLVDTVTPPSDLAAASTDAARSCMAFAPQAWRHSKELLKSSSAFQAALEREHPVQVACFAAQEFRTHASALLQRRPTPPA